MNIWILLAITWISISVVIADSKWFVQDPLLEGGDIDNADPFSSENLLRVNSKPASPRKVAPQPPPQLKAHAGKVTARPTTVPPPAQHGAAHLAHVESEELLLFNPTRRKPLQAHDNINQKTPTGDKTVKDKPAEWFIEDQFEEVEGKDGLFPSEHLIRVYTAKAKPPPSQKASSVKEFAVKTKPLNVESKLNIAKPADQAIPGQPAGRKPLQIFEPISRVDTAGLNPRPRLLQASANLENWFAFAKPGTPNNGNDDLSAEHYIRVQSDPKKQPAQHIETKQKPQAKTKTESHPQQEKKKSRDPVKAPTVAAVKRDGFAPTETARRKPLQVVQTNPSPSGLHDINRPDEPCDPVTDVDCLMEDEDLIPVHKNTPSSPSGHADVQGVKTETENPKEREISRESLHRRLLQNGEESVRERRAVELVESDELEDLDDVSENLLWGDDTPLRRFRRAENDTEESGDGGFDGETDITNSSHTLGFQTTMNTTKETLSETDIANITLDFVRQSQMEYQNYTGFQDVVVKNVTLDENGRVVIDWELILSTSAAPGNNQEQRVQSTLEFISNTVTPFVNNELKIEGQPIFEPIEENVINGIAGSILRDPCQVENACSEGYVCVSAESICRHLCYHNSFDLQCRHGSTCQLNDEFQPYCQCGSGYTGQFCQTPVSKPGYTTGQVVGAGAAGAVAAAGCVSSIIYLAAYRKKKEEDMEYSYFGDDDAPMQAYSDPDSNLGISNEFSIARPSLTVQPMDLYHGDGAMA